MKKVVTLILAVAMVVVMFVGCADKGNQTAPSESPSGETSPSAQVSDPASESASGESTLIGVSIMEMTAYTWFLGAQDGCHKWAEEHPEANFRFQFEDSASDVQKMVNNIDNLITAGAKGIILFPADASSAIPTIKKAVADGIPVIIGDFKQQPNDPADAVWSTFVGHDMKALGVVAGQVAVDYLKTLGKEDPTCLFITRPTSGQVSQDRFEGFKKTVLEAFPKANIIEEGDTGAGSRASAQDLMENLLQRESVIDVVCGHNDAEVVGAYNAVVQANRPEVKFIGIAGDKDVLSFLSDGNEAWLGEVLQDPVVLGYTACEAIYKALVTGEELPEDYELPLPEAITSNNIADYDWANWSWL